jgi:hypothetical protein
MEAKKNDSELRTAMVAEKINLAGHSEEVTMKRILGTLTRR